MGAGVAGPVLVVEDDPSIRQLLREALEQDGLEVQSAVDGAEAVRLAERRRPAAVVLDMGLPIIDGAEVADHIREAYGDLVPFVIVTASRRIDEVAGRIRAARYLTKPFDVADLVRAVRSAIDPAPRAGSMEGPEPFIAR